MKLQVALDFFEIGSALKIMELINPYVDIVEIGSPLIYSEGFRSISKMKEVYPQIKLLADLKIVDGGYEIGKAAYDAGAYIVTSIGVTNDATLEGLLTAARENKKEAMVDMIGVINLKERACELDNMGFDYILLHTAHDTLSNCEAPVYEVKELKSYVKKAKIGLSGGINVSFMKEIQNVCPDWVVIGSGITKSEEPLRTIQQIRKYL